MHGVDVKLVFANKLLNFMNLKKKCQHILKSTFVSFVLLVKLKCIKDQIHCLNWVLTNNILYYTILYTKSKIYYTIFYFYCKFIYFWWRIPSKNKCTKWRRHSWSYTQKFWMKNCIPTSSKGLHSHPNANNWRTWHY